MLLSLFLTLNWIPY